ncbi:MAG: hypothetical protein WKF96_11555 [Solirubrobacteraceae bacterium]
MTLSPGAQMALDQLTEPGSDPDEVLTVALPHGLPAAERQHELRTHQGVVDELRAAGWPVEVERYGAGNGEVLTIGLAAGKPWPSVDTAD